MLNCVPRCCSQCDSQVLHEAAELPTWPSTCQKNCPVKRVPDLESSISGPAKLLLLTITESQVAHVIRVDYLDENTSVGTISRRSEVVTEGSPPASFDGICYCIWPCPRTDPTLAVARVEPVTSAWMATGIVAWICRAQALASVPLLVAVRIIHSTRLQSPSFLLAVWLDSSYV